MDPVAVRLRSLIRYYGSDCYDSDFAPQETPIVPLKQGWNMMSTPVALDENADEMGEIIGLALGLLAKP